VDNIFEENDNIGREGNAEIDSDEYIGVDGSFGK
jgi:hypothetical protein